MIQKIPARSQSHHQRPNARAASANEASVAETLMTPMFAV
jgi:hypothetical protein